MLFIILMLMILLYVLDHFFTFIFCAIQKRKDEIYGKKMNDKPQYTNQDVWTYCFPQK